jgi:hypothetical protein
MSRVSNKTINFPAWVPQDVQIAVTTFYDLVHSDRECRYMLQRIGTRQSMKEVWAQQFEKFFPSTLVTWTFLAWHSAQRIRLMQKSVSKRTATGESAYVSSPSEIASRARAVANEVKALHSEILAANKITEVTQQELDRVATFFERQADEVRFWHEFATPPRKARARNADQVAFVNRLCSLPWSFIGHRSRPYSVVAILTNAAFDVPRDREWDADRVKHCYQSRSRSK